MKTTLFAAALLMVAPHATLAQDRVTLGWGRMFDNDAFGDFHDRWHTGSYTISRMRGTDWRGTLPTGFGDLTEFRMRAETIAPADLVAPDPADRRYVGALTFGLHTHMDLHGIETALGADLVVTGPQTGIGNFQSWVHQALGLPEPSLGGQLGDAVYPTVNAEFGRSFDLGTAIALRPFVAGQAGVETYLRAGGDITIGSFGQGSLLLRDETTGQRYRAIEGNRVNALSFTLGGDVAHVFSSEFLPEGGAAVLNDTRTRLRAGMQWQGERASAFYGVTYLSPEFDGQPEGQLVGSLNVNLRF